MDTHQDQPEMHVLRCAVSQCECSRFFLGPRVHVDEGVWGYWPQRTKIAHFVQHGLRSFPREDRHFTTCRNLLSMIGKSAALLRLAGAGGQQPFLMLKQLSYFIQLMTLGVPNPGPPRADLSPGFHNFVLPANHRPNHSVPAGSYLFVVFML